MRLNTDVLIIGAGPAGLTAALALSTYGTKVTVVTKHRSLAPTPRAHVTNQRSFEILRDLGIEADARVKATEYGELPDVVYCASLAGEEYARWRAFGTGPSRIGDYVGSSPCTHADLAQNLLEPILMNHSLARGADIRFNTEFLSFSQDGDSVCTKVLDRPTNTTFEVMSKFVIGADGAKSRVASQLQLPFEGNERIGHSVNILFESDLSRYVEYRPAFLYMMLSKPKDADDLGVSVLRPTRPWAEWLMTSNYSMAAARASLTEEEAVRVVRDRVGVAELPVQIKTIDPWEIHSLYATRYSQGRVFCIGDAVHRHPPGNGLGSNTAIQDAYNLAWKLALVVQGKASPAFLDSYDQERVPIGKQVVDRATKSLSIYQPVLEALKSIDFSIRELEGNQQQGLDAKQHEIHKAIAGDQYDLNTHGVEMNQHYCSSAVVSDGTSIPISTRDEELYFVPSTRPGSRLPHVWLQLHGHNISTLDLVGKNRFVLLTGIEGFAWIEAMEAAAKALRIVIDTHTIGAVSGLTDLYGEWEQIRDIDSSGCLLVRPDGYIGFRARKLFESDDLRVILTNSLAQILGLPH